MALPAWLDPVYDAARMGRIDRWAIEGRSVGSLELMEAAGGALAEATEEIALSRHGPIRVLCGKGNNGGDGLVAARLLRDSGHEVEVLLLWPEEELSEDAAANLRRYEGDWREVEADQLADALAGAGAVVDAILGTGFEGSPRSPVDAAIEAINASDAPVVACDVPSGVNGSSGEVEADAVRAALTVTFHAAKLGHLVAPGKWSCGEVRVAEIGIPDDPPVDAAAGSIGPAVLREPPGRGPRSTKFGSGTVVVVGGSPGLTGAPCLAASAASRGGAGYVQLVVPESLEPIFEAKLTEQMTIGVLDREGALDPAAAEAIVDAASGAGAVVLGPGIGRAEPTAELVRELVGRIEAPLVLDADGLGALAGRLELIGARGGPTVLTPHAGELGRLLERDSAEVAARRLASLREAVERSGAVTVLKGDDSLVGDGESVAVNRLAAPGLATAGTGDVLAGLIAALLSRGCEPFLATCAGVLAHARAGRIAAQRIGAAESVIASDVVEALAGGLDPSATLDPQSKSGRE